MFRGLEKSKISPLLLGFYEKEGTGLVVIFTTSFLI